MTAASTECDRTGTRETIKPSIDAPRDLPHEKNNPARHEHRRIAILPERRWDQSILTAVLHSPSHWIRIPSMLIRLILPGQTPPPG